jgi:hypothetical protein
MQEESLLCYKKGQPAMVVGCPLVPHVPCSCSPGRLCCMLAALLPRGCCAFLVMRCRVLGCEEGRAEHQSAAVSCVGPHVSSCGILCWPPFV